MEGVAPRDRLPVDRAPLAPRVEAQALDDRAGRVGDHVDRAEMVGQQVLNLAGPDAGRGRGVDDDRNARSRQTLPSTYGATPKFTSNRRARISIMLAVEFVSIL